MSKFYVTTAIPYVNAKPHLGHALEFVQADVLARHRRLRTDSVRFLSGTDDNALKNVKAAEEAREPIEEFVGRNAAAFEALRDPLELSFDDFIRTSADARHRPAVEDLWRRCSEAGDLYRRSYEGLYCAGCEQFYERDELENGVCPEHAVAPELVQEENWFFRLSRYEDKLAEFVESGVLRIEPPARRNEVLAFVRSGLRDVSVSRDARRARGWGIQVPDDPEQVIYVWFDALANYISALGFGERANAFRSWWVDSDERIHVIGKGILRFHAVWWPAILLSAGEPLPTAVFVHDYLTADGRKLSKSDGSAADPVDLVSRYGTDAVRWWLVRAVPRLGDADFTEASLVERHDVDLAGGIGNLVSRTVALARKLEVPLNVDGEVVELPRQIDEALAVFDLRRATGAILESVATANRALEAARPWETDDREAVVRALATCRTIAKELGPFLPSASERIGCQLVAGASSAAPFPRLASRV